MRNYSLTWSAELSAAEQHAYHRLFVDSQYDYYRRVEPAAVRTTQKTPREELDEAFRDSRARFLLLRVGEPKDIVAALTTYEGTKYVQVRHIAIDPAIATPIDITRKLLVNVQLEYAGRPLYGIARSVNRSAIECYQWMLGAEVGKYFFEHEHPDKRLADGWVGVSVGLIPSP